MKQLLLVGTLFAYLSVGLEPIVAQQCTQTSAMDQRPARVVFESGVALFAQWDQTPLLVGEVEVFQQSPASGVFELQQTLRAAPYRPGEEHFGQQMDTDGETIVVTSEGLNFPGEQSAVYIFEWNAHLQTWGQVQKLIPPGASVSKMFNGGIAVLGDRIAIGAPQEGTGVVYMVDRDPISGWWDYGQTLSSPSTAAFSGFGQCVEMDGDVLAIGDPIENGRSGNVYVYERSVPTGLWVSNGSILPSGLPYHAAYGSSMSMEEDRLLVGAPGYDATSAIWEVGAAFIWERDPVLGSWSLGDTLHHDFGALAFSQLGFELQLDGGTAFIRVRNPSEIRPYWIDPASSAFVPQPRISAPAVPGTTGNFYFDYEGFGVVDGVIATSIYSASSSYRAFRSASDQDCDGNGVSDLCEINAGTGVDQNGNGVLDACEGVGVEYCLPPAPNSAGLLAQLSADGSHFVGENNITLRAELLPPGQFGYALNSPYQGVVPNPGGSQGTLCIFGPSLGRHNRAGEVRYSGAEGEFDVIIDLTSFPSPMGPIMVQAGETWNFQV
ncbi:MAG: hypothetical protein P1V35_17825, partial [Planctomycetota bacterium]|nr:hypothetical protein [Planctomycetota bacterium]